MSDGAFRSPDHQSFAIDAGGKTGALLLHGFMGSPHELRPLARALADAGVSVRAPLLPGFGAELERLADTNRRAWVEAAAAAWDEVRAAHDRSVLLGFSMGGAVAVQVAAAAGEPPDRLILLAPFWKMADPRAKLLPVMQYVMREFKPFAEADFSKPELRRGLLQMDPSLDLDDPATQAAIRDGWSIPTPALVQLQKLGRDAHECAASVTSETLVIQGLQDDTSLPSYTRELVGRLGGAPRLLELPGGHQLVQEAGASWADVRDAVVAFASGRELA